MRTSWQWAYRLGCRAWPGFGSGDQRWSLQAAGAGAGCRRTGPSRGRAFWPASWLLWCQRVDAPCVTTTGGMVLGGSPLGGGVVSGGSCSGTGCGSLGGRVGWSMFGSGVSAGIGIFIAVASFVLVDARALWVDLGSRELIPVDLASDRGELSPMPVARKQGALIHRGAGRPATRASMAH